MRQLSQIDNNYFTTKLNDILIPGDEAKDFDKMFLVMSCGNSDARQMMESVKGGSKINEDDIVKILYNVLCAMKYFHSANLLHRDIKPANILIDKNSNV